MFTEGSQLPTANMADTHLGMERYSLFMEILKHTFQDSGVAYCHSIHMLQLLQLERGEETSGLMVIYNW